MDGARLRAMLEADIDLQSGRQEEEESESEGEREVWEMEVQGTVGALEEQGDGMNLLESADADMPAVEGGCMGSGHYLGYVAPPGLFLSSLRRKYAFFVCLPARLPIYLSPASVSFCGLMFSLLFVACLRCSRRGACATTARIAAGIALKLVLGPRTICCMDVPQRACFRGIVSRESRRTPPLIDSRGCPQLWSRFFCGLMEEGVL